MGSACWAGCRGGNLKPFARMNSATPGFTIMCPQAGAKRWDMMRTKRFCELLAYLLMDSEGDEDGKKAILRNAYTRGQSKLFIEAEQTYGLNDILDWMKYGNDSQLHGDDLNRVRNITAPVRRSPIPVLKEPAVVRRPAAPAGTIVLNGIVWDKARPLALINGRTFAPKEEGKVRVGDASVLIRCLDIQEDGVKITVGNSAQERELKVKRN